MRVKLPLRLLSFAIVIVSVLSLTTACGSSEASNSDISPVVSTVDPAALKERLKAEAEAVPEPDTKEVFSSDNLVGEWTDTADSNHFAKITKNGEVYRYEDNDGKYQGTFADGVLTIKVSDIENDTAKVFLDIKTGNLVMDYKGDIYEFTRKQV